MVSMRWASPVAPRVSSVRACVWPRVNSAEPCVRGIETHLAGDRPDLVGGAAVGAPLLDGDATPDDVLFELGEGALDLGRAVAQRELVEALGEAFDDLLAQLDGGLLAGLLLFDRGDPVDLGAEAPHDLVVEAPVDLVDRHLPLGLAGELGQTQLGVDQLLDLAVRDAQAFEHLLFGGLVGARFDHDDGVATAGHHEIEGGFVELSRAAG